MMVVGLTGGIASGKTTVSDIFAELGTPVIDTDILARELVAPGQPALLEVVELFGKDCLLNNGELNRRHLRNLVFADENARKTLESILHPRIRACVQQNLAAIDAPYCLVVIPLLTENSDLRALLHRILVVDVPELAQIRRVMQRDDIDQTQAEQILAAQAKRSQRLALADDVIENSGGIDELRGKVIALHQHYQTIADLS